MKNPSITLKTWILSCVALLSMSLSASAQDNTRHEVENMHVTIPATAYKSAGFIETVTVNGKEYVCGRSSSYKRNGEANAGTLLQPHAEYVISNKMLGGSYHVLVYYTLDRDRMPASPRISIGMNTQKPQEVELKTGRQPDKYAKATFKVSLLKGKKHTVKIWLPSEGVRVSQIKVMRALFNKKTDKE